MRAVLALVLISACASGDEGRADGGPSGMDAGRNDAAIRDATSMLDASALDATTPDSSSTDAAIADAPASIDASAAPDGGCTPGSSRSCTITCAGGTTAMGRETCVGATGVWSPCERRPEHCGNGIDDDGDGLIDEDCRVEGACIWVRPQCQAVMTLNQWCAAAGGLRLAAGRRCPVAGAAVIPLDATYGEFPLCCCDVASMCVPECTDPSCSSCVVWDEIQCCP